jgi:hypothetical protein
VEPEIILKDEDRTPCEVWSRVMGYHRPVSNWNTGKRGEFAERVYFDKDIATEGLADS